MRKYESSKSLYGNTKLKRFMVSFDLVLSKPNSERFSCVEVGDVLHKKGCFYARNVNELERKIVSTYTGCGRVKNLDIINPIVQ